ncbi:hypothetical protein [Streptomyces sp. DSM 118878]
MQPTTSAMHSSARSASVTSVDRPATTLIRSGARSRASFSARRALSSRLSMATTRSAPASAAHSDQNRSGPQPISSTVAPGACRTMASRNTSLRGSSASMA